MVSPDDCSGRAIALRYNHVITRAKPVVISCGIKRLLHFVRNDSALVLQREVQVYESKIIWESSEFYTGKGVI